MKPPILRTVTSRGRIMALVLAALILVAPAVWIAWSLHAASLATAAVDSQSVLLEGLQKRIATLKDAPLSTGSLPDAASIFLPGKNAAIAGAALQSVVSGVINEAGGRVAETEFAPVDPAENDTSRVDLRVAFEAEIASLQRILYRLETGTPLLVLRTLSVQTGGATEVADNQSPRLRVVVLVAGYREAGQ